MSETSKDAIESKKLQKLMIILSLKLRSLPIDSLERGKHEKLFKLVVLKYLKTNLVCVDEEDLHSERSRERDIDSFSKSDCRTNFRFLQHDLRSLFLLLEIPDDVLLSNGKNMPGQEVFLRGLYELVSGENQQKIAQNVFGGDQPLQSRAFNWFLEHIDTNFCQRLLRNNLDWWHRNGFWEKSAEAIGRKTGIIGNLVSHFIDCNCLPTSRPGGGPGEDGANAARWDPAIQEAFYNGWKSIHGLKHQTVDDAFGFTEDCAGPASLRNNDIRVLRESEVV